MAAAARTVKITKDGLDVLSQVLNYCRVTKILEISVKLSSALPVAGAVLVLIGDFIPDGKHGAIISCLKELSNKMDRVRDEIKEAKNEITWKLTALQFGNIVGRIKKGMQYCCEIGKESGEAKERYQERLMELCSSHNLSVDVDALLDGVTGENPVMSIILDEYYQTTGGDRPKVSALATQLLQLVCGGLMVIATYETMVRTKAGAEEVIKKYDSRLKNACTKVQSVLDDCKKKFEENMKSDLNTFLDKGGSNKDLVSKVSDFMTRKYDWLENFCLVYNDLHGFDQHCFSGVRVSSLHLNEKCGIVFYRNRDESPKFSGKCKEASKIVADTSKDMDNAWQRNAEEGHKDIVAKMTAMRIGWSGCAVITRSPNLQIRSTFSTKNVHVVGKNATVILLLQ